LRVLFFYRGTENYGIEYISAVLTAAGHQTELIYDPGLDNNFSWRFDFIRKLNVPKRLMRRARDFAPDLIAFSSITNLFPYVKEMARLLKAEFKVPSVIGGIHPTVLPELVLQEDCFDIVCRGEGEYALLDLVNALERGEDITKIPNLWVKDEHGVIHRNEPRPLINDLDSLPFADKDLFYRNGAFWRNVAIMTGRGCPYHCTYCVNSFRHRMAQPGDRIVRRRSVDNVIQELKICKRKYAPQIVTFMDDTFSIQPDWLEEFAARYTREVDVPFQCNVHPSTVTSRIVNALKKGGCRSIIMGVEAGNEEVRHTLMRRPESNAQVLEAARLIRETGIPLETELIVGLPEETAENLWETVSLNLEIKPASTATFMFYPFPGTDMAQYCITKGLMDDEAIRKVNEGYGSYLSTSLVKHACPDLVFNIFELLPLFTALPRSFTEKYMKRLCARKYGSLIRALGYLSMPLSDPWGARSRGMDYLHMMWRVFRPSPVRSRPPRRSACSEVGRPGHVGRALG